MLDKLENQNRQLSKCIEQLQTTLETQRDNPFLSTSPHQHPEDAHIDNEPLVIPSHHSTAANRMLTIKSIQDLVGTFDPDYFMKLEAKNPFILAEGSSSDNSDYFSLQRYSKTPSYVENFFNSVHPHFPILDKSTFMDAYNSGLDGKMSIIGHLVIALGAFIVDPALSGRMFHRTFSKVSTDMKWSFSSTIEDVQISLLCAIYFAYSVRPLESWEMVYDAAIAVQFLLK
jgi:Fungal specific transcription factor domain